jgi:hypothetical protein
MYELSPDEPSIATAGAARTAPQATRGAFKIVLVGVAPMAQVPGPSQ